MKEAQNYVCIDGSIDQFAFDSVTNSINSLTLKPTKFLIRQAEKPLLFDDNFLLTSVTKILSSEVHSRPSKAEWDAEVISEKLSFIPINYLSTCFGITLYFLTNCNLYDTVWNRKELISVNEYNWKTEWQKSVYF